MPSLLARVGLARLAVLAAVALAALLALALTGSSQSVRQRDRAQRVLSLAGAPATPAAGATASVGVTDSEAAQSFVESRSAVNHPVAAAPNVASTRTAPAAGAPSDAQVRAELKQLQRGGSGGAAGNRAVLLSNGQAVAPLGAPDVIARVISGGNAIADFPYIWGGGHGSFTDNGYDCSGSVSYALAAGGLLKSPLVSGDFMRWGQPGPGKWITIEASNGHVYMYVAGLRFDTSGRSGPRGSRWQSAARSNGGFVSVHPPGL
jgi:cell wall-associated NlpC family hydrolase